jgi:hypothetical protein
MKKILANTIAIACMVLFVSALFWGVINKDMEKAVEVILWGSQIASIPIEFFLNNLFEIIQNRIQ